LNNARSSWLSREILSVVAFSGASLIAAAAVWFHAGSQEVRIVLITGTSLLGLTLIVSMSNTYRLRTIALWKTRLTPASFFLTAGLLGLLLNAVLFVVFLDNMPQGRLFVWMTRYDFSPQAILHLIAASVVVLLIIKLMAMHRWSSSNAAALLKQQHRRGLQLYFVLALIGLGAAASLILAGERTTIILLISVACASIVGAEIVGRWLFYAARMWLGAWH
jgi:DMSO reductase anchor subunit